MAGAPETRILCFTTQGHDHVTDQRIRLLLEPLDPEVYPFDHRHRLRSAAGLIRAAVARRPALIVMEGTGIAGGVAVMAIQALLGIPFVVSSGDAVGPYLGLRSRLLGVAGALYERLLCRRCAGYVGWTPYLVGRALTFGAPRGMTAPGWTRGHASEGGREQVRGRLGIAPEAIVVGLTGALQLVSRVGYVYGAELVQAVRRLDRTDVVVCIVGDGSGLQRLRDMAGEDLGGRVLLPGRVPPEEVPDYLDAFDIASLSQSVDRVGSFRYTTKLSEYLAAGLPVLSGQSPVSYDLESACFWRLPGGAPWSHTYVDALTELLETLTRDEIDRRREAIRERNCDPFDRRVQQSRMGEFVTDLLAGRGEAGSL
ncbi:MAG TPA: glycosyltransferase [Solirubrobacteraceae bacterium]